MISHPKNPPIAQMSTVSRLMGMSSASTRFVKKRRTTPKIALPMRCPRKRPPRVSTSKNTATTTMSTTSSTDRYSILFARTPVTIPVAWPVRSDPIPALRTRAPAGSRRGGRGRAARSGCGARRRVAGSVTTTVLVVRQIVVTVGVGAGRTGNTRTRARTHGRLLRFGRTRPVAFSYAVAAVRQLSISSWEQAPDIHAEAAGGRLRLFLGLTQFVLVLGIGRDYVDLGEAALDHVHVHHLGAHRVVYVGQKPSVLVGALLVEL